MTPETREDVVPYHWIFYVLGLGALVGILMFGIAGAQTSTPGGTPTTTPQTDTANTPAPVIVDIRSDGTALVRGSVTQAGADSITIESWGGSWTIRMNDDGAVIPPGNGGQNDASAIQVGHFVGVEGMVARDGQLTIDASFVRDWTTNPYTGALLDTGATDLPVTVSPDTGMLDTGTSGMDAAGMDDGVTPVPVPPVGTEDSTTSDTVAADPEEDTNDGNNTGNDSSSSWNGTIDAVGNDSFTFSTDGGVRYTVDVSELDGTNFTDDNGDQIDLEDIDADDDVFVEGTYDGTAISPTRVEVDTGIF